MPIIKSAKKRVKQAEVRRQRNYPLRSLLKTNVKKVLLAAAKGSKEEAEKLLPIAYKTIDTAAKKNIIHRKNADNKKSRLARVIASIGKEKPAAVKAVAAKPKAAPAAKKAAAKPAAKKTATAKKTAKKSAKK